MMIERAFIRLTTTAQFYLETQPREDIFTKVKLFDSFRIFWRTVPIRRLLFFAYLKHRQLLFLKPRNLDYREGQGTLIKVSYLSECLVIVISLV